MRHLTRWIGWFTTCNLDIQSPSLEWNIRDGKYRGPHKRERDRLYVCARVVGVVGVWNKALVQIISKYVFRLRTIYFATESRARKIQ